MKIEKNSDGDSKTIQCYFLDVWLKVGFSRYSSVSILHVYRGAEKGGTY